MASSSMAWGTSNAPQSSNRVLTASGSLGLNANLEITTPSTAEISTLQSSTTRKTQSSTPSGDCAAVLSPSRGAPYRVAHLLFCGGALAERVGLVLASRRLPAVGNTLRSLAAESMPRLFKVLALELALLMVRFNVSAPLSLGTSGESAGVVLLVKTVINKSCPPGG